MSTRPMQLSQQHRKNSSDNCYKSNKTYHGNVTYAPFPPNFNFFFLSSMHMNTFDLTLTLISD